MDNYLLWVRFNTGEAKVFDCKPLLDSPAFAPLADKDIFHSVYIDYGIVVWDSGNIDIATEHLYEKSVSVDTVSA